MFAVYDRKGLKLRGTLEALKKHKEPLRQPVRRTKSFWDQADNSPRVLAFTQPDSSSPRYAEAEVLYRRMLNLQVNEPIVHVHQIMSSYVFTLTPQDSLADARRWMLEYCIEQMPVVVPDAGVVSLVQRRHIESVMIAEGTSQQALSLLYVESMMPDEVITTEPIASVRRVARAMMDYGQNAMPVVDEREQLVGIITRGDILRVLSEQPKLSLWT